MQNFIQIAHNAAQLGREAGSIICAALHASLLQAVAGSDQSMRLSAIGIL
jgi:hypothetical protein